MPWQRSYELVLSAQARLWGGSANLIFPRTADLAENELFWALAERFDADHYATAALSTGELGEVNPEWLNEWIAAQVSAMEEQVPDTTEAARRDLLEGMLKDDAFWAELSDAESDLLERRLSPFHSQREFRYLKRFHLMTEQVQQGHAFADVRQLVGWPETVRNPTAASLGDVAQLLLTAEVGRMRPPLVDAVHELQLSQVEGHEVTSQAEWLRLLFTDLPEDEAYPWTTAKQGLAWYHYGISERDAVVLVTGDTPWDFTLFYALRRWRTQAWWLPQSLMDDGAYAPQLRNTLAAALRNSIADEVAVVTSSDQSFRDRVAHELNWPGVLKLNASAVHWREVLPDRPHRLWESESPGRAHPVTMHEGSTVELPTPVPAQVRIRRGHQVPWITDVRVAGWAPIRHGALGPQVLDQPGYDTEHARTSRQGAAYTSTGFVTFGGVSLEMAAARPLLRPRSLEEQLNAALGAGWSCQASDKGVYASETSRLFGGFRQLAAALMEPGTRAVLEAFRDPDAPGKRTGDGRYLTLNDIELACDDRRAAEDACIKLDALGVINRGLFLKCFKCRQAGWYELGNVGGSFRCRRCRTDQRVTRGRWLNTVEPTWHYELAQVTRSFLDFNGELPVLAVAEFFQAPPRPEDDIEVAFELEVFSADGRKSELDIAVRQGPNLWLGEATAAEWFEQDGGSEHRRLVRLRAVADELAAHGVLLASSQSFRASTEARAHSVLGGFWPELHIAQPVNTLPPILRQRQVQKQLAFKLRP